MINYLFTLIHVEFICSEKDIEVGKEGYMINF